MHLAGRVAEVASGQSWAALFAERVAGPLGMTGTAYLSQTNPWVGGGLVSTAADYTALLQMVLDGGLYRGRRVLSEASVAAMLADQTGAEAGATPVLFSPFSRYAGTDPDLPAGALGYGVGVWREQLTGAGALRRASSLGAYGFSPWVDVERGLGGVLLVLDDGPDVFPTYLELKRRIAAALDAATTAEEEGPGAARVGSPFPNPTGGAAAVRYTLAAPGPVRAAVFDALGREVAVFLDRGAGAGEGVVELDTSSWPSGVYVVRTEASGHVVTSRLVVAR